MKKDTLYIKIDQNSAISNIEVLIDDVAQLYSTNINMVNDLKEQVIFKIPDKKENKYAFTIMSIIELVLKRYPEVEIVNLGETDFIVCYQPPKGKKRIWELIKVVFVAFTIFLGAAFTIMTFNQDVDIKAVFDLTYELIMGSKRSGSGILEIAYSVGIPIGTIVFFNHFTKLKINNDPTPLQVQMRSYEDDANNTIIENASRIKNSKKENPPEE